MRYGESGMTRSVSAGPTATRPTRSRKSLCSPAGFAFDARTRSCPSCSVGSTVGPDERRGLGAPQPAAEQQRDDRAVDARPLGDRRRGLEPAAALAASAGGEHQVARLIVGEGARLARRRRGLVGMLARDAAQRVGDERSLRRVRAAGRAAGGGDRRHRAPDRGQLRPLGAPGEVGGDLRRRGLEGRECPRCAPGAEQRPLRGAGGRAAGLSARALEGFSREVQRAPARRSYALRTVPGQRASGAVWFCRVTPLLTDPPRRPIEFTRKLRVQAPSRSYRLIRGVAVDDPKTPENACHVDVRLDGPGLGGACHASRGPH